MNPVTKAADVTMAQLGAHSVAQTGSSQREPSMEEILASIRRIIEDNDAPKKPAAPAVDPVDFEIERAVNAAVEVDAFRAELQAPRPEKPMSLADVQAQVLEESPDNEATLEEFPQLTPGNDPGSAPIVAENTLAVAEKAEEPVTEFEPALPAAPAAEPHAPRPALISEHAGRQVAAAFGELSEAFAQRSKKTFDDMAERMLRPMLQDWLDNNLPVLVERLVREEIERVARGTH